MKTETADFISARQSATADAIASLRIAAKKAFGFDQQEINALIERVGSCNESPNYFTAKDAYNESTGECYDAVGTLWSCNSKLCSACLAQQSRRNRKTLREALYAQKILRGERYYFATFTITNPKTDLLKTRDIVNRSWELFRKRKMCVDLIRGGSKSEEFTLTANGYHYHLHCIFLSKFMLFTEVRRVWTECVEIAFKEYGLPLTIQTKDGMLFVKMLQVTNMKQIVFEVCKYVTKSDSWSKIRAEDLRDIALVRRWHRMFEVFGSFSKRKPMDEPNSVDDPSGAIVHTRSLTDGEASQKNEYWRDKLERIGLEAYRESLHAEIARSREARLRQIQQRWPTAEIIQGETQS